MDDLRKFLSEKWLEVIIIGIILNLICGATGIWLAARPLIILLLAISLFLLLIVVVGLRDLGRRLKRPRRIGTLDAFEVRRRGVIVTLGLRSKDPNSVVFQVKERFEPEFFGFLGSPDTDRMNMVEDLARELKIGKDQFKSESWEPTKIAEGMAKTNIVIDWMLEQGLQKPDIVLDLTGGPATASVASFMASQDRQIDCQYIYSQYRDNKIVEGSQKPILVARYTEPPDKNDSPAAS